jgi:alanyl-tRNA synthetase
MRLSKEIRAGFLSYFEERNHQVVRSGPLVPANDPTLMFTNAGMVQFKEVFTGQEKRDYTRACSSQKCIRISGKHNDLENVGVTARHHTFFEMLGNFSFGDYFKREAIGFGWEFLTRVLAIPEDRLVVTVFGGEGDLPADSEAEQLWREVTGFPSERIIRCGAKDNFWQMGDTGPCGPSSEIHFFNGSGRPDISLFGQEPGPDGEGWVELWNLVFTQFDRSADGQLTPLPAPSIDTGAGLERLAAACQGVLSNYDTDILRPVVEKAAEIAGKKYNGTLDSDDVSMRVIADHARMTAFLIAEGIFPDRDGRPYVLRRVMRRAIRHAHKLGIGEPCLHECALKVVELMGDDFPELVERRALIEEITQREEERFRATLKRGLDRLETYPWNEQRGDQRVLPGSVSFELYDTYGFPVDLQEVIGEELKFRVDREGFERELEQARRRSAGSKVGEEAVHAAYRSLANRVEVEFVGYQTEEAETTIVQLLLNGDFVHRLSEGETGEVVTALTPFYAETGGQVGDKGEIRSKGGSFKVVDTVRPAGALVVHRGKVTGGEIKVGDVVQLEVDHALRADTRRNHSATHLLHLALRRVAGDQAMQKGSLVTPDRLRFDYSGTKSLTQEQMRQIEQIVMERVLNNTPIETEVLPIAEAKRRGAVAIFEEKYGDIVRMVRMADSIELCGGTHAARTGDIGLFKLISDSGIAAGVRRIEAMTGRSAIRYISKLEQELLAIASLVKGTPLDARAKVDRLLQQQKELTREIARLNRQLATGGSQDLTSNARKVGDITVLGARVEVSDIAALRETADRLRDQIAPAVVLLGSVNQDGKVLLVCTVSRELTKRIQAGALVKQVAKTVGGSGGGRPDFAQAGGTDGTKLDQAIESIYKLIPL